MGDLCLNGEPALKPQLAQCQVGNKCLFQMVKSPWDLGMGLWVDCLANMSKALGSVCSTM